MTSTERVMGPKRTVESVECSVASLQLARALTDPRFSNGVSTMEQFASNGIPSQMKVWILPDMKQLHLREVPMVFSDIVPVDLPEPGFDFPVDTTSGLLMVVSNPAGIDSDLSRLVGNPLRDSAYTVTVGKENKHKAFGEPDDIFPKLFIMKRVSGLTRQQQLEVEYAFHINRTTGEPEKDALRSIQLTPFSVSFDGLVERELHELVVSSHLAPSKMQLDTVREV